VVLAALGHDVQNRRFDARRVALGGLLDLREAGGVDVQGIDVDQDFAVPQRHGVVDLPGGLGQHALGFEHAVGSIGAAVLHVGCSLFS
jgi:hypothetical protein